MTIVIEGSLTTEKVEKALEKFEKEARIKNLRKKFWQLDANITFLSKKLQETKKV
jgi:predicted RNase H-like nuclease (RuvC/YqgF family)